MTLTTLSKIKDGEIFAVAKYSKTRYKKIEKVDGGFVFTSTISEKSFTRAGSFEVYKVN